MEALELLQGIDGGQPCADAVQGEVADDEGHGAQGERDRDGTSDGAPAVTAAEHEDEEGELPGAPEGDAAAGEREEGARAADDGAGEPQGLALALRAVGGEPEEERGGEGGEGGEVVGVAEGGEERELAVLEAVEAEEGGGVGERVAEADEGHGDAGGADAGGEDAAAGARAAEAGGGDDGGGGGERAGERGGGGGRVVGERAPAVEAQGDEGEGAQLGEGWAEDAEERRRERDELEGAEAGDGEGNGGEGRDDEAASVGGDEEAERAWRRGGRRGPRRPVERPRARAWVRPRRPRGRRWRRGGAARSGGGRHGRGEEGHARRSRPMSRFALWMSVLAVLVFGPACKGSCRQLAEKLCSCAGNTYELNACNQAAATEQGRVGTTSEDEAVCQSAARRV